MARVEIEGVGIVEVDDSFRDLSLADQQKTIGEIRDAKLNKASSFSEVISAPARGFNVGFLADTLGAPVDLMNFLVETADVGLEKLGVPEDFIEPSEAPFGGSESIKGALVAGGMGYRDEQDLPVDQRALARGGRTVGQATGMAMPVFGAASRVSPAQAAMQTVPKSSIVRNLTSDMVKSTARSPGKMAAIEGATAVGAGQGRAIAEAVAPGNEFVGMPAEIIGGVVNPMNIARTVGGKTKRLMEGFSPSGREDAASRKVRDILEQNQFLTKDPEVDERKMSDLVEQLRGAEGSGTTAQVTQDPQAREIFTAIENKLISDAGDELKTAINTQTQKAANEFNKKIRKLNNSTNPLVVKEAQAMRIEFTNKKLDGMVEKAQDRAVNAVSRVLTKNKDDAVKASAEARQIIDDELKIARNMETRLWDEVDKGVPSPTDKTIQAFNSIKDEISPNEQVRNRLRDLYRG